MFEIFINGEERYDEEKNVFISSRSQILHLEHSLVSVSKWESTWQKPFLTKVQKTEEESIDYVRCMTLTQNVSEKIYGFLTASNMREIERYIASPMTATTLEKIKDVADLLK